MRANKFCNCSINLLQIVLLFAAMSHCTTRKNGVEKIVEMYDEPFHKLVFEKGDVRIMDVQLMPKDTTLYHIHRNPLFYVSMGWQNDSGQPLDGDWDNILAPVWPKGEVESDTSYASKPLIHRATNKGKIGSRLIAILNTGPGTTTSYASDGFEVANRWFRSCRIRVNKGDSAEQKPSAFPVILVIVGGSSSRLIENGQPVINNKEWYYLEQDFKLINTGDEVLEVIKIEVLNQVSNQIRV